MRIQKRDWIPIINLHQSINFHSNIEWTNRTALVLSIQNSSTVKLSFLWEMIIHDCQKERIFIQKSWSTTNKPQTALFLYQLCFVCHSTYLWIDCNRELCNNNIIRLFSYTVTECDVNIANLEKYLHKIRTFAYNFIKLRTNYHRCMSWLRLITGDFGV